MATVGDIYLVRLSMTSLSQSMQNVWTYRAQEVDCNAEDLVIQFLAEVIPPMQELISEVTFFDNLYVENLASDTDFHEEPFPASTNGNALGEAMPLSVAGSWVSPTKNKSVRAGSKRLGLIAQVDVSGNNWASGTSVQDALIAVSDAFSMSLDNGSGAIWSQVIIKRDFVPATEEHKAYYVIPENTAGKSFYFADNWVANQIISTQNSRKVNS